MTSGPLSAKLSTLGQTSSYATDEGERLMKEKGKCGKKTRTQLTSDLSPKHQKFI